MTGCSHEVIAKHDAASRYLRVGEIRERCLEASVGYASPTTAGVFTDRWQAKT